MGGAPLFDPENPQTDEPLLRLPPGYNLNALWCTPSLLSLLSGNLLKITPGTTNMETGICFVAMNDLVAWPRQVLL